jgi:hypothetical protein
MGNADAYRRSVDLSNRRNCAGFVANYATDCEYIDQARNATAKGREQIQEFGQGWTTAFPEGQVTDARVIDGGSHTVPLFTGSGINDGPLGPLPPAGPAAFDAVLRDSRVRHRRQGRARTAVLRPSDHAGPARSHAPARGLTEHPARHRTVDGPNPFTR